MFVAAFVAGFELAVQILCTMCNGAQNKQMREKYLMSRIALRVDHVFSLSMIIHKKPLKNIYTSARCY